MTERRALPSIDALLQRPGVRVLEARHGHDATVATLRASLAAARVAVAQAPGSGPAATREAVAADVERDATARLGAALRGTLRPVVNATGVVIHTNLGRAPLAEAALTRLQGAARGYCTLEYDLTTGTRGSRSVHAEGLLTALTGAEAAVVVNNNAAAVLLLLAAVARGREVLVSRGELVEIGGGFRVPDVMAQSGAALREVGTTNRTRVSDFTASSSAATALWLRVHPSNFRIAGFTERPALPDLVAAAHAAGVPLAEDLGSGNLDADSPWESTVQASLAAGVDVVCVSADKMLGGPQAGIVLGRRALVDRLRTHPLMRALRVDKLTYAALEGTLVEHWAGRAHRTVPVLRMLHAPVDEVRVRAEAVAARLLAQGWDAAVLEGESAIGGGSAPGVTVPTALVRLSRSGWSAERLASWLRERETPIIARIQDDAVVLDLRTVAEDDDQYLSGLAASP
jgi:L-seryl-tRNA(Ser) seleniumtransferase